MKIAQLRQFLDNPAVAPEWLRSWGLADIKRGHANLVQMAVSGLTLDLLAIICSQLSERLPGGADPDMALNNLGEFVSQARNPLSMGTLFERDPDALPTLLQIFATSQHLSDLLISDPESFDLLRVTEGQPVARQALVDELVAEVEAVDSDSAVMRTLRRFKRRETLRIAYGDIVRQQSLAMVTTQISRLADAVLEAALRASWRKIRKDRGAPRGPDGQLARFVVLAMGKLGGVELNYSSDIDLIFLYEVDGQTDGRRPRTNREFFDRLAKQFVHLLTEPTELGCPYRVDLRLRPDGRRGPMVIGFDDALRYYDSRGRTWERQAYIKARPVAGDLELGDRFLEQLRPWIYRRYLSRADISGIKALKRRIEDRAQDQGADSRDVKTGHGGIRDIEFAIQFLQLLNGAGLPALQTPNTLEAVAQLANVGCLSDLERSILSENYTFLRQIEHRLQIMFDLRTHVMPEAPEEVRKLALRMEYTDSPEHSAREAFQADYRDHTELNRKILDHLLHDAFGDDAKTEAEVDLVLDPDPSEERIAKVLGKYPFRDVRLAYRHLMALAEEKIRFLSTRRCRHFLAAIAPQLLEALAATPDPDSTLVNLGQVSDSLGGKGVLWELFSFNEPSLRLYVRLCAYSPYLSSLLTTNPGMLDGLMDSLVLDKLPTRDFLRATLTDLCRAAEDPEPILHSFKNDQQLRVGIRDLLGKEDVQATTRSLSDIAETCLEQIANSEHRKLAERLGAPRIDEGRRRGKPCEMVILAMGKFGGREMNYYSDLDIVFLYEAEGHTTHAGGGRTETTTNQHFFSELAQRIIRTTSRLGAHGRLFEVDARLRPTGRNGALSCSLAEFERYFAEGDGQLWERQALCKARAVLGSNRAARAAQSAAGHAAFDHRWRKQDANEIRKMRARLEEAAGDDDLKRGAGGIVDVEFLVQMLQLKHARRNPALRHPNTLAALTAIHEAGHLADEDAAFFVRSYRFLRTIEGRLRLLNLTARNKLPDDPTELTKLAHLLRWPSSGQLLVDVEHTLRETRQRFERVFDEQGG